MTASDLHNDAIVIDALMISNWSRAVFEDMRNGGLTAVNCTCSVWENFPATIANIAQWRRWFAEHEDILLRVRTTADIKRAKAEGKTGIILGFQNTSAIEDQLDYLGILKDLGVGIMQLTYNTQNYSGAGCWEPKDAGLTGFGGEVVERMAHEGIVCDLSHVGDQTTKDAIVASPKPVCFTHAQPLALFDTPRNKSPEAVRLLADHGGIMGVSLFTPGMKQGNDATVADVVDVIAYLIDEMGEEQVAIGTDFTQDHKRPSPFQEFAQRDKGYARFTTEYLNATVKKPLGFRTIGEWPNVTAEMEKRGWKEGRIRRVLGENWMRLLKDVWGA